MTDSTTTYEDADAIRARYADVQERIEAACARSGRAREDVTLIAVSKTWPPAAIQVLYDAGVRHFGENYVQEWQEKVEALPEDIRWHFVGHLQSNKAKYIVNDVAVVHSVDRKSVIKKLNRRADDPVDVLLQVNVAGDDNKSGVAPDEVLRLLEMATARDDLRVRGLMTLPPYADTPEDNRGYFKRLRELLEPCQQWLKERDGMQRHLPCDQLSMGMSNDFEVAIEEGATMIRVGSALFGPRQYDD